MAAKVKSKPRTTKLKTRGVLAYASTPLIELIPKAQLVPVYFFNTLIGEI